jgi:hypothetical protein
MSYNTLSKIVYDFREQHYTINQIVYGFEKSEKFIFIVRNGEVEIENLIGCS